MNYGLRQGAVWMLVAVTLLACQDAASETTFVCPPCAAHDTLRFHEDGVCPICGMELMEKPDSSRVGHAHIETGSGNFLIGGGPGHRDDLVTVFYHRPESFTPESPVLLVIPGAGRNGWDYRDAWVEASEEHGVLILSPSYVEEDYGFGQYHMGGLIEESNLTDIAHFVENSSQVTLDEDRVEYEVNAVVEEWIFDDFDRLFRMAAEAVGSTRETYDVFGHSAGGQILHRLVLVYPETRADRLVAANSGFYTLPDLESKLPFGLAGVPVSKDYLRRSFRKHLILLLGAEDDHPEAGGTFLRSPSADRQGLGRLQRGRQFYRTAKAKARELGAEFRWELGVVPGVGHDHQGMTEAAAAYLYGSGIPREP